MPPGADVRYCIGNYSSQVPAAVAGFMLSSARASDYGRASAAPRGLPPYKRFFAGGPDTVRGFPRHARARWTNGNPYGGNMLTSSRTELLFPMPAKWQTSARVSVFFDMGNVFSNDGTKFVGEDLQTPVNYNFSYHALRTRPASRCSGWRRRWASSASAYGMPLNPVRGDSITSRTTPRASSSRSGSRSRQEQA